MRCARELFFILGLTLIMPLALAVPLRAQDAKSSEPAPPQPGLLDQLGNMLKSPVDMLPSLTKPDTPQASPPPLDAAAPAPPAPPSPAPAPPSPPRVVTGSKAPPPETRPEKDSARLFPGMVTGRELCPVGANGAPDCQTGSNRLCQSKGYKSGNSLNTDTAFNCSARIARASGKACGNEHFVTSALCN